MNARRSPFFSFLRFLAFCAVSNAGAGGAGARSGKRLRELEPVDDWMSGGGDGIGLRAYGRRTDTVEGELLGAPGSFHERAAAFGVFSARRAARRRALAPRPPTFQRLLLQSLPRA